MKPYLKKMLVVPALLALLSTLNLQLSTAHAQGTAFTYQGQLDDGGVLANGTYDFRFQLYDTSDPTGPETLLAGPVTNSAVTVSNGLFTTAIDFGVGIFGGSTNVWLQISVQTNGASGWAGLLPRQQITPTPYAIFAGSASNLLGAFQVGTMGSFIGGGGSGNVASGAYNAIGGGSVNGTGGNQSTIAGGAHNIASGNQAVVGGGFGNSATNDFTTVSGGHNNNVNAYGGTVGGGVNNTAGSYSTVAGGAQNYSIGFISTIGGGQNNTNHGYIGIIAGGDGNTISGGNRPFIGGGENNIASGDYATISGGENNTNNGNSGTIAGGQNNNILQPAGNVYQAAIGGGYANVASNSYATVPGGYENVAGGQSSFAAGQQARALHQGAFVWADSQNAAFSSTANDQFLIRAQGGVGIGTPAPGTLLDVQGNGTASGGVSGYNEVAARFKNTTAGTHTAVSIDSLVGQSSILYLAEGGAAKWDLRRDGNPGGSEAFEMRWHGNGGNSSQLTLTTNGNLSVTGGLRLNDQPIYLRTGSDVNHGLGYNGGTITNFGTGQYQIDGPALWGYSGGVLGTRNGGDHTELTWNTTSVNIGFTNDTQTSPPALGVVGNRSAGDQLAYIHNIYPPNLIQSGPALRVVNDGDSPDGALSVSVNVPANTSGNYIAEFGNSSSYVVQIGVDGTVYSKGLALTSDRNAKEDFAPVSSQAVLAKVAALPITEWNYKTDATGQKHLGPMAQDFHAAFDLNGTDDKHISVIDEGGVALAAIQGLNEKVESGKQKTEIRMEKLAAENAALQQQNDSLARRLEKLEQLVLAKTGGAK